VALIGAAHPKWGETPVAVIVPKDLNEPPTATDIGLYSRARLGAYKCPREVALIGALPRNPSGKVLKNELRDLYASGALTPSR
jgi:fatty-acyl-CoA synthase